MKLMKMLEKVPIFNENRHFFGCGGPISLICATFPFIHIA